MTAIKKVKTLFTLDEIFPEFYLDSARPDFLKLANRIEITQEKMAEVLGVNRSTLARNKVRSDEKGATHLIKLLTTLALIVREQKELDSNEKKAGKIIGWLNTPNAAFELKTPFDLISSGRIRLVQKYAEELLTGYIG